MYAHTPPANCSISAEACCPQLRFASHPVARYMLQAGAQRPFARDNRPAKVSARQEVAWWLRDSQIGAVSLEQSVWSIAQMRGVESWNAPVTATRCWKRLSPMGRLLSTWLRLSRWPGSTRRAPTDSTAACIAAA